MKAKLVANAIIVDGEDVLTLIYRGFGSKFYPSSIQPSNHIHIVSSTNIASQEASTALMTISLSVPHKNEGEEIVEQEDDNEIDRLILRHEEVIQYLFAL